MASEHQTPVRGNRRLEAALERLRAVLPPAPLEEDETAGEPVVPTLPSPPDVDCDDDVVERPQPLWDPADIDRRIAQLTNGRWLRPWRRREDTSDRPPMISEIDASGVDRTRIAPLVSPEHLSRIERETYAQRARLTTDGRISFSYQHELIQALQRHVLEVDARVLPEMPDVPESCRDTEWHVGDVVRYGSDCYTVREVTARKIYLDDSQAGSLNVYRDGSEMRKLQLVRRGLRVNGRPQLGRLCSP